MRKGCSARCSSLFFLSGLQWSKACRCFLWAGGRKSTSTSAPPRTTQRQPHAGEMRVTMVVWRHGGSHASSFDYRITHSHNSGKICNSELILDSLLVPWWFDYSSDTASSAGSAQQVVKRGSPSFSSFSHLAIRWLQCPSAFDGCCGQSPARAWLCCMAVSC